MVTQVTKVFDTAGGVGVDFTTEAQLRTYLSSTNFVAIDSLVTIYCASNMNFSNYIGGTGGSSLTQRPVLKPKAGMGVNDLNTAAPFNEGATGISITFAYAGYSAVMTGITISGFRLLFTGATAGPSLNYDGEMCYNRIYDLTTGASGANGLINCGGSSGATVHDNLVVVAGVANKTAFYDGGVVVNYRRNTIVAKGAALNTCRAIGSEYAVGSTSQNDVFIGCGPLIMGTGIAATNDYANTTPTSGRISGITVVSSAGGLVVNESSDYRPAAAGGLINTASSAANSTLDILGNNRGIVPDVGAWELSPAAAIPAGVITAVSVTGRNVTISGTTTGTPTSVMVAMAPSGVAYNDAVAIGATAATLGSGTFTITFNNAAIGQYTASAVVGNSGGTANATSTIGAINVVDAQGVITSETINGQQLVISGTTTGSPTSGTCSVPAALTNGNGSVTAGPVAITLGSGTFTVTIPLVPGNYDTPIVRFTTAAGTSLPATGGNGVSVIGISGNPQAPVTNISVAGPTTGFTGVASDLFNVLAPDSITSTPVVVTPSDGGAGGTFSPTTVTLSSSNTTATFTYTTNTTTAKTISFTNNGGLSNPANLTYTAVVAATALTLTGPNACLVGRDSANFTVAANGPINGTVVVTPVATGGGTFTPATFNLTSGIPTATFTYKAASAGNKTVNIGSSLAAPAAINLTSTVPAATKVTINGPVSGTALYPSTDFSVGLDGFITNDVTVVMSDTGDGGTFTPATVTLTAAAPNATFKYTPVQAGSKNLSFSNNAALTNPPAITFTVSAGSIQPHTVSIVLGNSQGPVVGMSNIKWTWQDTFAGPVLSSATNGSTDGSGVFSVAIQSVLPVGAKGFLKILGANDVHFNGPVVVS